MHLYYIVAVNKITNGLAIEVEGATGVTHIDRGDIKPRDSFQQSIQFTDQYSIA